MEHSQDTIPYGFCHCGCGQKTKISKRNRYDIGHIKDESIRYVHNHHGRSAAFPWREEDRGYATPCHIWLWTVNDDGYGMAWHQGRNVGAHVVAFLAAGGVIPPGKMVDHLCRQRACVNAAHMEVVSNAVNARRGKNAKLDWEKVREIRALRGKVTQRELARRFGMSQAGIGFVQTGRTWAASPGES